MITIYGCSTDMGSILSRGQSEAAGRNRRCGPPLRCGQVRSPVGCRACRCRRVVKSDMRGLVTAGPWVRSRSWAAGLEVERDLLRGNVIAHRTGADHSETLTRHRGWLTWTFMWAPAQSSRTASDQDQPASSRAIAALATTGRFLR